jgi:hypothetical protein
MPSRIEHIDAIAPNKGCAMPYPEWHPRPFGESRNYRYDDDAPPGYQVVRDYLEHPDGTMRRAGLRFHAMPLEHVCKRWAEDF